MMVSRKTRFRLSTMKVASLVIKLADVFSLCSIIMFAPCLRFDYLFSVPLHPVPAVLQRAHEFVSLQLQLRDAGKIADKSVQMMGKPERMGSGPFAGNRVFMSK